MIAKYRPTCPILVVTRNEIIARQSHLWRGLHPLLYLSPCNDNWSEDVDDRINYAIQYGTQRGFLKKDDTLVLVTGSKPQSSSVNTVTIINVQ